MQHVYARSYAQHLLYVYHGQSVKLTLRRHMLPSPDEMLKGARLNDPRSYEERPLGEFTPADFENREEVRRPTATAEPGDAEGAVAAQ
jgi:hypothetical protein